MVVFRNGERAMQVLPALIDVIAEARLNLVIYHMHHGEVEEGYNLMKDLEPTSPQEYILKGVVNLAMGQALDSREHLKVAQQYFQLVRAHTLGWLSSAPLLFPFFSALFCLFFAAGFA